ncbi:bifunctional DNA primase/polymerase [Nocardia nova]|uniref:bifunctional DNA primase/polymerase n=1 Tax=Nocardia nova TaxID=37330 RepID=UPI00273A35E6|nr:bifunctional DNA primase/polymerase [Nocardia nova]
MTDELGYGAAASKYWQAGFRGVLPLPHGSKIPPPKNTTGHDGYYPSFPDIQAWIEDFPNGNLALRLPNTVVGIDVDHYGDKRGGDTLAHAESLWGPLPSTVRSTARDDGVSGIRLFRIPAGVELETVIRFPDRGLGDIEVCQKFHRYVVAWPSLHGPLQRRYRWLDPEGNQVDIPRPGELPELPASWIEGLKRKTTAEITATANTGEALGNLPGGEMSMNVAAHLAKSKTDLLGPSGSRHDITRDNVLYFFRLAEPWRGETGIMQALVELHAAWMTAMTRDGSRTHDMAESEWARMVRGQRGHDLIASTPGQPSLADLMGNKPVLSTPPAPAPVPTPRDEENQRAAESFDDLEYEDWDAPLGIDPDELLFAEEEGLTQSQTSWGPVDLAAVLAGDLSPEVPTVLARSDGRCVFYPGRINALVGPPESAKSWVAQLGCQQEMSGGNAIGYLDFEDTDKGICARFKALSLTNETLIDRLYYANPDSPMGMVERDELFAGLDHMKPTAIVVDGVNAAMTLLGLDLEKNRDATQFHQLILKPLALTGAAVIIIDHVTKAVEARGNYAIGAQAKRAMIDGAMIGVNCVEPFGRGRIGKVELETLKDKQGGVREISERRGKYKKDYLGTVIIDARQEGRVLMTFRFEEEAVEDDDGISRSDKEINLKRIKVSQFLETDDPNGEGRTMAQILDGIKKLPGGGFRKGDLDGILHGMEEQHYIERFSRGQAKLARLLTPYRGMEAPVLPGPDELI